VSDSGESRNYDVFTLSNGKRKSCVTVTLIQSDTCLSNIQSAAYRPSYNPADLAENYRADIGASLDPGEAKSYSFIVPRRETFQIVVNEVDAGDNCGYTLRVSGMSRR
jgi:hypothetical protein